MSDVNEKLDADLEYVRRQIEHNLEADEHVCQILSQFQSVNLEKY